jgi:hypothetical protein
MFGNDVTTWKGKQIMLYVDPNVKMKGETVGGIRIRPVSNRPAPPKPEPEPLTEPQTDPVPATYGDMWEGEANA